MAGNNFFAANDMFAEIAAVGISCEGKGLITPQPPTLKEHYFSTKGIDRRAIFTPLHKISTKEELYEEVKKQKEYYKPFFRNLAPSLESCKKKKLFTKAQWRIGTDEDCKNFAGVLSGEGKWREVQLPHYGEPRGFATTYYRMSFELSEEELAAGSLWTVFKGVDYKAHIFLNGMYVGSHEGFFAPFEFEFKRLARVGENILCVMVENDYIHMGSVSEYQGIMYTGDKFYAATGLGYDEPYEGWHHCPAGMGIYQDTWIEFRSEIFVSDVFVRPQLEQDSAEVWLELYDCKVGHRDVQIDLSVYGQNFEETVIEHLIYFPHTTLEVGMGDSLTEAQMIAAGKLNQGIPLQMEKGINYLKIPVEIKGARKWELDTPWLYQVQVRLLDEKGSCLDTEASQFGMRNFMIDESSEPKGKFRLNGREVKMRGANSMGFEQQCVYKKDWEQLLTDLILAKVCNMNFIRLTQRPVQEEVYDYCDKLGLMLQTDLPLFGCMRRNQFAEGVRQAQEMERLIRSHASAVMISYINEPMPNAKNMPHRSLMRKELEDFFTCADIAVRLLNPDRSIKHVDGDYDPPTEGFPDNHCYPCWYNGHGIDIGRLYKGYWMSVKDGWHYGCGEYGIEGIDPVSVMRKYYPAEWLPTEEEEKDWTPLSIPGTQTGSFHYFYYDTQHSMKDWEEQSHKYQALAVSLMTESYRRDCRMNSFAYHLFISAFPGGWCKTLMDVERSPKPAFFAYRNALEPVMVSLRSDRWKGFSGDRLPVELWICNDTVDAYKGAKLLYQIWMNGELLTAHTEGADAAPVTSTFQGFLDITLPQVKKRTMCTIQAGLADASGELINTTEMEIEVFPERNACEQKVCLIGKEDERVAKLAEDMGWQQVSLDEATCESAIVVNEYDSYKEKEEEILNKVKEGSTLLICELSPGEYEIADKTVRAKSCSMLPLHFASRDTGHKLVEDFAPEDIRYWYDSFAGYITPLLNTTITVPEAESVLTSGNQDDAGKWIKTDAAVQWRLGNGIVRICQVKLAGRTEYNPTARELASRLVQS